MKRRIFNHHLERLSRRVWFHDDKAEAQRQAAKRQAAVPDAAE